MTMQIYMYAHYCNPIRMQEIHVSFRWELRLSDVGMPSRLLNRPQASLLGARGSQHSKFETGLCLLQGWLLACILM